MDTPKPYGVARLAPYFGAFYRWRTVIRVATPEEQQRWLEITRTAHGELVRTFTGSIGDYELYDRNGNPKKYR